MTGKKRTVRGIPVLKSGDSFVVVMKDGHPTKITKIESEFRFAFTLKNAARVMAKNAAASLDQPYHAHAFVVGAVVLAYSSLEAAFDEFLHCTTTNCNSSLTESQKAIIRTIGTENLLGDERGNVLALFNMMLRILGKSEISPGTKVYDSADLVRQLRNMCVHPKVERVVTLDTDQVEPLSNQQRIVKKLRGVLRLHEDATFPNDVITADCAHWAVNACEEFFKEFTTNAGVAPGYVVETLWGFTAGANS